LIWELDFFACRVQKVSKEEENQDQEIEKEVEIQACVAENFAEAYFLLGQSRTILVVNKLAFHKWRSNKEVNSIIILHTLYFIAKKGKSHSKKQKFSIESKCHF